MKNKLNIVINKYENDFSNFVIISMILISLLKEIRLFEAFTSVFSGLQLILLLLSFLIVLNESRQHNKEKINYLLYLLAGSILLSTLLSPQISFSSLKEVGILIVVVLGYYPYIKRYKKADDLINRLSKIMIPLITLFSLVSILLFFLNWTGRLTLFDTSIPIGVYNNRLFGVYHSIIVPIAPIGIFLTIRMINENYQKGHYVKIKYLAAILINYMYISLSFSTGVMYSMAASLAFLTSILIIQKHSKFNLLRFLLYGILSFFILLSFTYGSRHILHKMQPKKSMISIPQLSQDDEWSNEDGNSDDPFEKKKGHGFLSGRMTIWEYGINEWKDRPLLGYGPSAFRDEVVLGTQPLQHFHNNFVQSLVSGGVLHAMFFILYIFYLMLNILKLMIRNEKLNKSYRSKIIMSALIVYLLIAGLVETNILYVNRISAYMFWFSAAYIENKY